MHSIKLTILIALIGFCLAAPAHAGKKEALDEAYWAQGKAEDAYYYAKKMDDESRYRPYDRDARIRAYRAYDDYVKAQALADDLKAKAFAMPEDYEYERPRYDDDE